MRSIAGLWRWRSSPLRRSTDRAEGWLTLGAVLLAVLLAPAAGLLGCRAAQETLAETVREQQRERQRIWVTVAGSAPRPAPDSGPDSGLRVDATWTTPDGRTHSGTVTTDRATEPGERLRVWVDAGGGITSPPMAAATASSYAVLTGFGTAIAAAGLVEALRRLVMRRLMARRYARWEEEWARVGPDWGRAGRSN